MIFPLNRLKGPGKRAAWKASQSRQQLLYGIRDSEILDYFVHKNIIDLRHALEAQGCHLRVRCQNISNSESGSEWRSVGGIYVETDSLPRRLIAEILGTGFRVLYRSRGSLAVERFGVGIQLLLANSSIITSRSIHGTQVEVACVHRGCESHRMLKKRTESAGRALTRDEFLSLRFSHKEVWHQRSRHVQALVALDTAFASALPQIRRNLRRLEPHVERARISSAAGLYPAIADAQLWESHDLFFVAAAMAGFRHHVLPYRGADLYLAFTQDRTLYSGPYYRALPRMTDSEVETFLRLHPIEIAGRNVISGGRHRVSAMLGRLARMEDYIPVYVTGT